jgi:hypothetical protein
MSILTSAVSAACLSFVCASALAVVAPQMTPTPWTTVQLVKTCPAGRITCEQWCDKYSHDKIGCKHGQNPGSCWNRPGGLQRCVRDKGK